MKLPVFSAVLMSLSVCSFVAAPARAQEPAPPPATTVGAPPAPGAFGSQGQLVISTDIPVHTTEPSLFLIHESATMNGGSSTSYGIEPSLDYFVAPNVSVGGALGVAHGSFSGDGFGTSASTTLIEVAARAGYNLALTDALSLWPRLGFAYDHFSTSGANPDLSGYSLHLTVFAPLLWHPTQHFFVGGGIIVDTELVSKINGASTSKLTDVGLEGVLGGYFGI